MARVLFGGSRRGKSEIPEARIAEACALLRAQSVPAAIWLDELESQRVLWIEPVPLHLAIVRGLKAASGGS